MNQFADEAIIEVWSGKGGNGCVAFRREKYIPRGGPNGGDGGKGGSVIFKVKRNVRTLAKLRFKRFFKAQNGGDGQGWNRFGKDGEDIVIELPPGTAVRDAETRELIKDFTTQSEDEEFVFLKGGNGGWGNVHFKSSTNQAPKFANKGQPGEYRKLLLELSVMADIGLVGFPNAGKSSLLSAFTNARPKIAPYPFTTKIPNLGVLRGDEERDVIIADIPGIIEGAAEGKGLGIDFLKHISRTAGLIFMIDCSDETEGTGCFTAYEKLSAELENYSAELAKKPRIILLNKIDLEGAAENAEKIARQLRKSDKSATVIPISVATNSGFKSVKSAIMELVSKMDGEGAKTAAAAGITSDSSEIKSSFLAGRSVDEDMEVQEPGSER